MAEVISEAKLLDPRNRARVEQSLRLIFKGKAWVAGQDPALRPFVNALVQKGATSAQDIFNKIQEQKQQEARIEGFKRVQEGEQKRFQQQLTSGEVLGFSGTGLTPQEMAKRDFLIKTGIVKGMSSRDPFLNLEPLQKEFFIYKTPSVSQQQNFSDFINSTKFQTTSSPKKLNVIQQVVQDISKKIIQLRNTTNPVEKASLVNQIKNKRNDIVSKIKRYTNLNTERANLLALGLTNVAISTKKKVKNLYEKFSSNKWIDFTTKEQYAIYKRDFGGKLSLEEFEKQKFNLFDKDFRNSIEGKKISMALARNLEDQIKNPDKYGTTTRITALISIGGGVGLSTAGMIVLGSTYQGSLGLMKDVSRAPLPKGFKNTAKLVAKNFGWGAVQGLIYGTVFKAGGGALKYAKRPLLKMTFSPRGGRVIGKGVQLAIQRGLSILGINYISRLAGRTTFNIKNIAIGEQERGVAGLSKDVGVLVGFAIPTLAGKLIKRRDVSIEKKIVELQKFRKGSLNAAYLKAKNAQLTSSARGNYKSLGSVKKLGSEQINVLQKFAKTKGISKTRLMDGALYKQTVKVKSDVPKYEALIKVLKARLQGKTITIKNVPKFYTFTRYGIVMTSQSSSGVSRAFAIEFNLSGGKISNIGFKTGVGKGKIFLIKVFQKAKNVKGKPIRAKLKDVYISKSKFKTTQKINEEMIRVLNRIETKKVFIGGKRLTRPQLLSLKSQLKRTIAEGKNPNLETVLKKIYKDKSLSGTGSYTNTIRIQRIKDKVVIKLIGKKNPILSPKIYQKGQYIEIGFSKFKIPSRRLIRVTIPKTKKPSKILRKASIKISKKIKIKAPEPIKIKVKKIARPSSSMKIEAKRGITKTKATNIQRAVKSIQTIVKPRARITSFSKQQIINIIGQIGILLSLVSTKNIQSLKAAQENLRTYLSLQKSKQIQMVKTKQIQDLQSQSILALKSIQALQIPAAASTPTIVTPRIPRTIPKLKKKKEVPIPLPNIDKRKKKSPSTIPGLTGFVASSVKSARAKKLNKLPLFKERAFDFLAFVIDKNKITKGRITRDPRKVSQKLLKRKISFVPIGYFAKNRKKFIVKKIRNIVETYEMVEKKFYRSDNRNERIKKKKLVSPRRKRRK